MIEIYGYEKNSLSFSGNTYVHHACGLRQQRKSRDHKHAGCDRGTDCSCTDHCGGDHCGGADPGGGDHCGSADPGGTDHCGGGTIPLLQEWLRNGMSLGSAAAFMITGPATKITNLGALKIMMGFRRFLLYLIFVMAFSFAAGLAVNACMAF